MQSPGEWGGEKTNLLQASLREFRFFSANPALQDHPCHPSSLRVVSHRILPIRVNPCYPWLNKNLVRNMIKGVSNEHALPGWKGNMNHGWHGWARIKRGLDAVAGRMGRRKNKPPASELARVSIFFRQSHFAGSSIPLKQSASSLTPHSPHPC